MEDTRKEISLHCVFCRSTQFAFPFEGYRPHHSSFVVCANCGRENDFTSLILIAKRISFEFVEDYAKNMLEEEIKKIKKSFKGNKYIRII